MYGRRARGVKGFAYSADLKKPGVTWNVVTLEKWLSDVMVPDNKTSFAAEGGGADGLAERVWVLLGAEVSVVCGGKERGGGQFQLAVGVRRRPGTSGGRNHAPSAMGAEHRVIRNQ